MKRSRGGQHAHLIGAIALGVAVSSCGSPPERAVRPEQVVEFDALYDENCAGCHGDNGRRGVAQPLNDATYLALVSDARLRDVVARGVPGTSMSAFARDAGGSLTDEQVGALADGMKRKWGGAQPASVPLPPYSASKNNSGNPARGLSAFRTFCARCHGDDGTGGPKAGSVVDRSFLSLTSDQSLRTTIIVGRSDEGIPGWRDYVPGRPMTDQEITDIVAWLAEHRGDHD
jgi:mono/diheme cytochrome c family protein